MGNIKMGLNLHSGPTPRGTLPAAATVKEHTAPKRANDFGCCIAGKWLGGLGQCRDEDGLERKPKLKLSPTPSRQSGSSPHSTGSVGYGLAIIRQSSGTLR